CFGAESETVYVKMDRRIALQRDRAADGDGGRKPFSKPPEQLASLTPLRGIAALWVVIFHFCWYFPAVHPERYTGAVYKGYLAVDMFFVLSGFVITHVYKGGFAHRVTGRCYRDFLKARVARIYPLHITVLLLFVATATVERAASYALKGSFEPIPLIGERSLGGFFANVVMLQGLWARAELERSVVVDQPGVPGLPAVSVAVSGTVARWPRRKGRARRLAGIGAGLARLPHRRLFEPMERHLCDPSLPAGISRRNAAV